MPHIAADLIANIEVTGAETAAFALDGVSANLDTIGSGAAGASAELDAFDIATQTLGASLDAIAVSADAASLSLSTFTDAITASAGAITGADAEFSAFGANIGAMAPELAVVTTEADTMAASLTAAGNSAMLAEGGFTGLDAAAVGVDGALAGASSSASLAEVNISGAGSAAAAADSSIAALGADAAIADAAMGDLAASALLADGNIAGAGASALAADGSIAGVGTAAATSGGELSTFEAEALLAETNIAGAGAAAATATPEIAGAGSAAATAGGKMKTGSLAITGLGVAMLGLIAIGVKMASSFDYTLATIEGKLQVLGGATKSPAADMEALRTKAMELGRDTVFSAGQAADAMLAFARAGRPVKEIIDLDTIAALNLAGAVDANVPEAATIIANMMNVFQLKGTDAARISDILTVAVLKSGHSLSEMGTSMGQAANIAESLKIPFADVAAVMADFMRNGIQASTAGSTFKTILDHLVNPSKAAKAIMDEYNFTLVDSQGNFIGVSALAQEFHDKFGALNPIMQLSIANTLGLQRGQQGMIIWMREGSSAIDANTAEMNKGHPAAELMAIKMDTLSGAMHQLKGSIDTVLIVVGSAFVPAIRSAADHITHLANMFINLNPQTQTMIAHLFAAVGAALAFSGGMSVLGGSLGTLLGPMKAVGAVMVDMGPWGWLAAAAVVGFALAWKNDWFGIQEKAHASIAALGPVFDTASAKAKSFGDAVGQKGLGAELASIDWPGYAGKFEAGAGALIMGLVHGLENHWKEIPGKIANFMGHLAYDIGSVDGYLQITGVKLIAGLAKGIVENWKQIGEVTLMLLIGLPLLLAATAALVLVEVGKGLVLGLINGLDTAFPGFKQKITDGIQWISDQFANAIDWLLPGGIAIITGLNNGLAAAWYLITTSIPNAIAYILDAFVGAWNWLTQPGQDIIGGLDSGLGLAWHLVVDSITGAITWILGEFSGAGTWLSDAGAAIVQGLADGITGAAGKVTDAVNSIVNAIPDAVKSILGINSPSKVMADLAIGIPEGMALGMKNGLGLVNDATSSVVSAATPNLANLAFGSASSGSGGGYGSSNVSTSNNSNMAVTINVNGAQANSGIVNDIMAALGQARQMQVGM